MPNRTTYIIQGVGAAVAAISLYPIFRSPWFAASLLCGLVAVFGGYVLRKYKLL